MCCRFAELDISSAESVARLRQLIERDFGGAIHSLINNAAISYGNSAPFAEQAEVGSLLACLLVHHTQSNLITIPTVLKSRKADFYKHLYFRSSKICKQFVFIISVKAGILLKLQDVSFFPVKFLS